MSSETIDATIEEEVEQIRLIGGEIIIRDEETTKRRKGMTQPKTMTLLLLQARIAL